MVSFYNEPAFALDWGGGVVFHVRPESGEPIYQQLMRQIKHAITTGALKTEEKLPTVRKLAADLVINPNTVARAYRELEREGLLKGGPRRGTFVRLSPPSIMPEERRRRLRPHVENLIAEATVLGFTVKELKAMIEELGRSGNE